MNCINKYLLSTFFLILITESLFSQTKDIDSLKRELTRHTSKDTTRVNILNSLAYSYNGNDNDKAEEKAQEANKLAKKLKYKSGEARSYFVYSHIHISKSENDDAKEDGLKSLALYQKINDYNEIIYVYSVLGKISLRKHDSDKALEYYEKGLSISKKHTNLPAQAEILKGIGNVSYMLGEFEDALRFYKKSASISDKLGDKKESVSAMNNIAVIYLLQGKTLEALDYLNQCLIIHKESNNKDGIATVSLNIGGVYWEREQPEKAIFYLKESLRISKELNDKRTIAKCLGSIGAAKSDLKEYSEALKYLTEALVINEEINDKNGIISNNNHIGGLYIKTNEPKLALEHFEICLTLSSSVDNKANICYSHANIAEAYLFLKNYPKAIYHGLEGKRLADELGFLMQQKGVTNTLSKAYEAMGDFKKSLSYLQLHKTYNDSLFNKKNIEKITQLEYEYKYKSELDSASHRELKLSQEVKTTNNHLEVSQRKLLLGVIVFLLIASVLGAIIFLLKFRNVKSKNQNIVIEQKLLRSQMTPHFIFNSLSVLQGMILNKEDKKAVSYLSKFSKLLRIILENSRDKTVSLNQELIAVENYLALHNIEENQAYIYTLTVDESVDTSVLKIPPMLIQPFIENSIEHAFGTEKENRKIDVSLMFSHQKLICTISDNGIGIDAQVSSLNSSKKSLATTITSERLKILSKDFKVDGSVTIEDRNKNNKQGTIVTLVIPYKLDKPQ